MTMLESFHIEALREALGNWSRPKLAVELEVSEYSVRGWEVGRCYPRRRTQKKIIELAERHGIDIDKLTPSNGQRKPAAVPALPI